MSFSQIYELKVLDTKPAEAVSIIECDMKVTYSMYVQCTYIGNIHCVCVYEGIQYVCTMYVYRQHTLCMCDMKVTYSMYVQCMYIGSIHCVCVI